jgi:hypothetical protein
MIKLASVSFLVAAAASSSISRADTADNILRYSDEQIDLLAKMTAESVSRSAPMQVDSETRLLGVVYLRDAKAFIYKYDATVSVAAADLNAYAVRFTCANRILKALMVRGVTIDHVYYTPAGEQKASVTSKSCK